MSGLIDTLGGIVLTTTPRYLKWATFDRVVTIMEDAIRRNPATNKSDVITHRYISVYKATDPFRTIRFSYLGLNAPDAWVAVADYPQKHSGCVTVRLENPRKIKGAVLHREPTTGALYEVERKKWGDDEP